VTKEELLGRLSEAHDDLLIATDAAVTRGDPHVEDGWGVRETLAHIAAWETEATGRIPAIAAGAEPREYDDDAFNRAAVAACGDRPLHAVRDDLERAHARLVALLDGLDEVLFAPDGTAYEWVTALTAHSRSTGGRCSAAPPTPRAPNRDRHGPDQHT